MKSKENRRKIIEIYITKDETDDSISFDFDKVDDSDIANATMKMLLNTFTKYSNQNECEIEVTYSEGEEKE